MKGAFCFQFIMFSLLAGHAFAQSVDVDITHRTRPTASSLIKRWAPA
jgi:hypothetical protein